MSVVNLSCLPPRLLVLVAILLAACSQKPEPLERLWSVEETDLSAGRSPEYVIDFPAGKALLVKARGFEVEFELTVTGADRQPFSTRTPYTRLGPQYQLLEARGTDSTVTVQAKPASHTKRARLAIEGYLLEPDKQSNAKLVEAYRLFARALESTETHSEEVWRQKTRHLEQAAGLLAKAGRTEAALWALGYRAYFRYFPLGDLDAAIDEAEGLLRKARASSFGELAVFAEQLIGQAQLERNASDEPDEAKRKLESALAHFDSALSLAQKLGLEYEVGWAMLNKGIGNGYLKQREQSIEFYRLSLRRARALDDALLTSFNLYNLKKIDLARGRVDQAISRLEELAELSTIKDNPSLLALNLSERGRLHRQLYEVSEALQALTSSLELLEESEDVEGQSRTLVNLASLYVETGNFGRAAELLDRAGELARASNNGMSLFDIAGLKALIARRSRDHRSVAHYRKLQEQYLVNPTDRARLMYETARDDEKAGDIDQAQARFLEAERLSRRQKESALAGSARLRYCNLLLQIQHADVPEKCHLRALEPVFASLMTDSRISRRIEARALWAGILHGSGGRSAAIEQVNLLLEEIAFFQDRFPGAIGSWYWESRRELFELALSIQIGSDQEEHARAVDSFLLFENLRNRRFKTREATGAASRGNRGFAVRELLQKSGGPNELRNLAADPVAIDRLILEYAKDLPQQDKRLDRNWLASFRRSLPNDTVVLAFYPVGKTLYTWVVSRNEVLFRETAANFDIAEEVQYLKGSFRAQGTIDLRSGLARVGGLLLAPIAEHLARDIYFLPAGPFNGFPLDALVLNDAYLVRGHSVVNVQSLADCELHAADKPLNGESVALAVLGSGNAGSGRDLAGVAREVAQLAEIDADWTVTSFSGDRIEAGMLGGDAFATADIIHIASHAVIDETYPELSKIYLGGSSGPAGGESYLMPVDIEDQSFTARLVVLSSCDSSGVNQYAFDSNLGFVSEFLGAGADAVLASLWPVPDRETARSMAALYRELTAQRDPQRAVAQWKRAESAGNPGRFDWAAFQLYR